MPRQFLDHPLSIDLMLDRVMEDVEPHQSGEKIVMLDRRHFLSSRSFNGAEFGSQAA
jgi:hypothetical protein